LEIKHIINLNSKATELATVLNTQFKKNQNIFSFTCKN